MAKTRASKVDPITLSAVQGILEPTQRRHACICRPVASTNIGRGKRCTVNKTAFEIDALEKIPSLLGRPGYI